MVNALSSFLSFFPWCNLDFPSTRLPCLRHFCLTDDGRDRPEKGWTRMDSNRPVRSQVKSHNTERATTHTRCVGSTEHRVYEGLIIAALPARVRRHSLRCEFFFLLSRSLILFRHGRFVPGSDINGFGGAGRRGHRLLYGR